MNKTAFGGGGGVDTSRKNHCFFPFVCLLHCFEILPLGSLAKGDGYCFACVLRFFAHPKL